MHFLIGPLIGILLFVFIISIIIIFSFRRFSPIPYFPSHKNDIPLVLKMLSLQNNQTIIDLGAGDGLIIFTAAQEAFKRRLNTKFLAVEINPILILVLFLRRLLHPNKENIKVVRADMFMINYSSLATNHYSLVTFYLYASPWLIENAVNNIKKQLKQFNLLSYYYPVPFLPNHKEEVKEGVHKIYKYSKKKT